MGTNGLQLQELLTHTALDPGAMDRLQVQHLVPHASVGQGVQIIDDMGFAKKGILSGAVARDAKGMSAEARRDGIKGFVGVDDPYESPQYPEITLDAVNHAAKENAGRIPGYLIEQGFVRATNT